jgi:glycine/serine hydroxymethyltransferase
MSSPYDVDLFALERALTDDPPALIYIDQSTVLFPVDPRPLRVIVDKHALSTRIHYDSSHLNGLILGRAMFNPLERGSHTFGGSTHKTLPGPHKGFLATGDAEIGMRIQAAENVLTSHHQPAAVVSLGITLLELLECGGQDYAQSVLVNARQLAQCLADGGLRVAGRRRGFTACHQVWIDPTSDDDGLDTTARLESSGIRVNRFRGLPGIPHAAYRLSAAELTRLGGGRAETEALADILIGLMTGGLSVSEARTRVHKIRGQLSRARYCFTEEDLVRIGLDDGLVELVRQVEHLGSRFRNDGRIL